MPAFTHVHIEPPDSPVPAHDSPARAPASRLSGFWHWRLPLLALLAWIGWRHLRDPEYASIFSGITLALHELGHLLFGFFGDTLAIAGGSLAQIAFPIIAAALLYRQRDRFGAAVCGSWLSFSLALLATYVADARAQALPLVGFTEDPKHDWYHLLSRAGLLEQDLAIARAVRLLASVVLVASLAYGARECLLLARSTRRHASTG